MSESITSYMQQDHVLIDGFAERAVHAAEVRDWVALRKEGGEFLRRLGRHIEMEENVLFPAFEQRTGMVAAGPSKQMRLEHETMRPVLAQMQQAVEANDSVGFQLATKALFAILQPHNVKEEQMMYPMLDDAVGSGVQALLLEVRQMAI